MKQEIISTFKQRLVDILKGKKESTTNEQTLEGGLSLKKRYFVFKMFDENANSLSNSEIEQIICDFFGEKAKNIEIDNELFAKVVTFEKEQISTGGVSEKFVIVISDDKEYLEEIKAEGFAMDDC